MSKRAASYDIDQRTFQQKERENHAGVIDPEGSHMQGRKIFRIAKPEDKQNHKETDKIDLKIDGLFDNKTEELKINEKLNKNQASAKPLFSNSILPNPFSQAHPKEFYIFNGVGLFNEKNNNDGQEGKEKKSGESNTSLFGGNSYNIFSNKPIQAKASLFGNNNQNKPLEVSSEKKTGTIFNFMPPNTQQNQGQKGLLFAHLFTNDTKPQASLFNNNSNAGNPSLFGGNLKASQTQAKNNPNNNEQEGDSQQLQKQQEMIIDQSKAKPTFDYKEELTVLKTFSISKFKKDKGQLIENVTGTIAFDDKLQSHLFIVKIPATKKMICSGLIIKNKSMVRKINEKTQNLQMTIFAVKFQDKKNHLEPVRVKIQIGSSSEEKQQRAEECFKLLSQIIEGKSQNL